MEQPAPHFFVITVVVISHANVYQAYLTTMPSYVLVRGKGVGHQLFRVVDDIMLADFFERKSYSRVGQTWAQVTD